MFAAIAAAGSTFEVIGFGEYHPTKIVVVEVFAGDEFDSHLVPCSFTK
jgi:hypothetical protein